MWGSFTGSFIFSTLDINVNKVFLISCDSTIVLSWLSDEPSRWKLFVAKRMSEIPNLTTESRWSYVPPEDNPADLISRGIEPNLLREHHLWWTGPTWLLSNDQNWPTEIRLKVDSISEERNVAKVNLINHEPERFIFDKYASLHKLVYVFSWCIRFVHNLRVNRANRCFETISVQEYDAALIRLIKLMQGDVSSAEIFALKNSNNVPNRSSIKSLDPFLDNDNLLEVASSILTNHIVLAFQ